MKRALLLTVKSANVPFVPEVPPVRLVIVAVVTLRLLMPASTAPIKSTFVMSLLHMLRVPRRVVLPAVRVLVLMKLVESALAKIVPA